jgi:poly(3-hydroxybutyrate) depolymerase
MAAAGLIGSLLVATLLAAPPPLTGASRSAAATPDTLRVASWRVLGPLPAGSREPLADPFWQLDPARLDPADAAPGGVDSVASFLAPDGWVRWLPAKSTGDNVALSYEGTDWDGLTESWGAAGVVSAGMLIGELYVPRTGGYRIEALGVGGFTIDGRRYVGNPYAAASPFVTPAVLDAGRHRIALRVSGMGPREVTFRMIPVDAPLVVWGSDPTLPDLVAGQPLDGWGAIPIANLSADRFPGGVLRFGDGERIASVSVPIPPIESEGILKLPFPVRTVRTLAEGEGCREEITLDGPQGRFSYACSLRVRGPRATRIATLRSREDGSVQKYGVLPPASDASGPFALVFSLHGASCDPEPQVASYAPKDWAYVIAPTNTRPYGFDWQDWGRLNAIATLDEALARYPIDPNRVYLVGHSMGGHGTWHVGTSHTDRFAAMAPSAGWATLPTYVPFTLRRDVNGADPRVLSIVQRSLAPDNPFGVMANLRDLPVYVLHGQKDDNVPVFQGRWLAARAREEGARVTYREVPEMGHWWDDPATPGVDCVDLPAMMDSLRSWRRAEHPRTVTLRSQDLGTCNRSHWLTVEAAEHPFDRIVVDARVDDGAFHVSCAGARAIAIEPAGLVDPGKIGIEIDGDRLSTTWSAGPIHLARQDKAWTIARQGPAAPKRAPIKAAFFAPFVFVYATGGSAEENDAARRLAILDAQSWYLRSDGYAPVLPDTAITPAIMQERNLILYATPGSNAVLRKIAGGLPIRISREGVGLAGRTYRGSVATRFAYPNPIAPGRIVEIVAGTDRAALELAGGSNPCYSGSGFPDFVVYDAEARRQGWGAVRAAGFFDEEGKIPIDGRDAVLR